MVPGSDTFSYSTAGEGNVVLPACALPTTDGQVPLALEVLQCVLGLTRVSREQRVLGTRLGSHW